MKKTKLTRYEKLDKKYGILSFSKMAEKNEFVKRNYEQYLFSKQEAHHYSVIAFVWFVTSGIFFLCGILDKTFFVTGAIFLIVAVHSASENRIETLWAMRWLDKAFEAIKDYMTEEKGKQ